MNYEPNTIQWGRGSIVIHDADAKEPKMLMKIIGFTRDGLAKCQYVDKRKKRTIYPNRLAVLHDPEQFGLNSRWGEYRQDLFEQCQADFENVRIWNSRYFPGQPVKTTSADGGFQTVTVSRAKLQSGGFATVHLEKGGMWLLKFVEVVA